MTRRTSAAPRHRATTRVAAAAGRVTRPAPSSTAAARHRADRSAGGATARRVGAALAVSAAAAVTTSAAATGVLPLDSAISTGSRATAAADLTAAVPALDRRTAAALRDRGAPQVSRSDRRPDVDPRKAALLHSESTSGGQLSRTEQLGGGDPRAIAEALLPEYGFSSDQFSCLDALWTKESGWHVHADNPSSSAYGIPQALPGSKMASAGADWAGNPATQVRWGLGYIRDSYGTPCGAWAHSQSYNWY